MGQSSSLGCTFGTLHICQSEDGPGGNLVLPSRCGSASHSAARVAKSYNFGLGADSLYIGSSSFGTALKATHRSTENVRVLRAIPRRRCDHVKMLRELEVLQGIDHPALARVYDVFEDSRMLWLGMEVAPGEDLLSAVAGSGQRLTEWFLAQLFRQLLLGLQHLHAAGLAHEDVQPRNILATDRPPGKELRLKLIDFGLAGKYSKGSPPTALQCCHCLAPEQISASLSPRALVMEPSCDIWAVGTLAFLLLSGQWPIDAENQQLLRKKLGAGLWAFLPAEAWAVSERAQSFVSALLVMQASKRPSAAQALDHPFLRLDALDKRALQPLVRSQEVVRSLQRLSSQRLVQQAVVEALASQLQKAHLMQFRKHLEGLDPSGRGLLTFLQLRRGLVEAGVELPGRLLGALLAMEGDVGRTIKCEDLVEVAGERCRGLEEVLLWAAWCTSASEGSLFLRREEVPRVLEKAGPLSRQGLGRHALDALLIAGGNSAGVPELPENVGFDDLLAWLRAATQAPPTRDGAGITQWLHKSGSNASALDLAVRLPPPPHEM